MTTNVILMKPFRFKRVVAAMSLVTLSSICVAALAKPIDTVQATGSPPATAIGVIDVGEVIDQYPVYIKLRTGLGENLARCKQQIDDKAKQLEILRMTVILPRKSGHPDRSQKAPEGRCSRWASPAESIAASSSSRQ